MLEANEKQVLKDEVTKAALEPITNPKT